jgi:lipoprotein signal peptidase
MDSLANDRNDYRGYYFLTAVVVLLLDQATKAMVSRTTYHWPDFNVADSAIVLGCLLLITDVLNQRAEPETS